MELGFSDAPTEEAFAALQLLEEEMSLASALTGVISDRLLAVQARSFKDVEDTLDRREFRLGHPILDNVTHA
jgi:hypothetical protein